MKKEYEAPIAEKISFCYQEQVVASDTGGTGGGSHICTGTRSDAYVMCRDNTVWND